MRISKHNIQFSSWHEFFMSFLKDEILHLTSLDTLRICFQDEVTPFEQYILQSGSYPAFICIVSNVALFTFFIFRIL